MNTTLNNDFMYMTLGKKIGCALGAVLILLFCAYLFLRIKGIDLIQVDGFVPNAPDYSPSKPTAISEVAQIKSMRAEALRNLFWGLGSLVGFILAILGIVNSLHRTQQKEKDIENELANQIAARRIADSNIFSSGVTKLGAPEPEIQVGGLYELEALAKSDFGYEETDESLPITIKNTIANFIRLKSHTNFSPAVHSAAIILSRTFSEVRNFETVSEDEFSLEELLNVNSANFSNANFPRNMNFSNMDLSNANFDGADLVGANFTGSKLRGAIFTDCNLSSATLHGADILDVNFMRADLNSVDFTHVQFLDYKKILQSRPSSLPTIIGIDQKKLVNYSAPINVQLRNPNTSVEVYAQEIMKYDSDVDLKALKVIVNYLGIALQNKDSSYIACSDESERQTVVRGFCMKKLGMDKPTGEIAVKHICMLMSGERLKSRVIFYYLLAKEYKKLKYLKDRDVKTNSIS